MSNPGGVHRRVHHAFWRARRCALALLLCEVPFAHAQSPLEVELDYAAEPPLQSCPSEAEFRRMLSDQLGRDPVRSGAARRVVARAHGAEGLVVGSVRWQHSTGEVNGEREMRGAQCEDLIRAMAFAVAVQIELFEEEQAIAEASGHSSVDNSERAASSESVAVARPMPLSPRSTKPVSSSPTSLVAAEAQDAPPPWSALVGFGAGARLANGVNPLPEGRLLAGLRRANLSGEVVAGGTWPGQWLNADGSGFRHWTVFGSVSLCVSPRPVAACSVVRFERLGARGVGVDVPRAASTWLVDLGPRFVVFGGPRPWQAALYVEARATLTPARVLLSQEQVWKSPPWSLTVGLDIARWWGVSP